MSGSQNINSLLASIPKLNGSNYHDWKFDMSMIFRRAGTWKVISGITKKPAIDDDNTPAAESVSEAGATRSALEKWEAAAEDGLSAIGLTIEQSQKPYIRDCEDGPSAWEALKDIYERNTASARISLKRRFYSYEHDTGVPMTTYINNITSLAARLRAIGVTLSDTDIIDVLIYSLASTYGSIATSLMTRTDYDELTVSEVSAALIEEEARQNGGETETAMMARGTSMEQCGNCGKRGHSRKNCWSRGGGGAKKCFTCGGKGHLSKDCANNERSDFAEEASY